MACLRDNFQSGVVLNGRYRAICPLNHGSFGMVFMASDINTDETVAIKCLTKKEAADDIGLDLAIDEKSEELILHSRLGTHPNIVNLINTFETEAHLYLVLEFCPQGDLYEAIRNGHGPLETEHVRRFMLQLVDAVDYIHSKGIFHRDIKPENIFLTKSGDMKLGDFGLATTENWTLETTVGSDRYMSPEQYDSAGAGYSPAQADIWAIGICLLNILFSRNPFTTPTEADPLFLDFSRDKQSLFDVFPSMSQDTYEVIVQCMSLDPKKRSLVGARAALQRVVSFTTTEEDDDEFCSAERHVMASANREPLRTPSIQSPQVDQGAFPWTRALYTTPPKPIRHLSAIADDESYTEDLFSKSGETADWFCSAQTPSVSSTINSSLGASLQSLHAGRDVKSVPRLITKISPMAGSLPINMAKPRSILSSMSSVFGRKDVVSKSWSDMWDEDEEEEAERERQTQSLQDLNSRTWSHDSKLDDQDDDDTVDATPLATTPQQSHHDSIKLIHNDIDSDHATDGFFFQQSSPPKPRPMLSTRQLPQKCNNLDKWSALGQRRRGLTGSSCSPSSKQQRTIGLGYSAHTATVWDHAEHHNHHLTHLKSPKDKVDNCPWKRGRDWNYWRREKRNDLTDVDWVGGW